MKQVIVFDLDDTLYNEKTFVISGFKAVADYLAKNFGFDAKNSLGFMTMELDNGRGAIFNKLLENNGVNNNALVKKCISIYRLHKPEIQLDTDAVHCLERLKMHPLYIITDGNKVVQNNKLVALGLYHKVKKCFITHRHGVKYAKPSPYCMLEICKLEKINPENAVYIADNPIKDFIGIKPLGFKTIRILKGMYKNAEADIEHNAGYSVKSLDEINEQLLNKIFVA